MRSLLIDALDHPMSKSWPSSSPQHQMRKKTAVLTAEQDERDSLRKKRREGVVMKRNNCAI